MSYTAIRQVVQTQLETQMGIRFVGGRITGPIEDRDIGCCWINTLAPMDDVVMQACDLRIRVFKQWKQPTAYADLEEPQAALEQLALNLQTALNAILTSGLLLAAGAWFLQDMPQLELDPDTSAIEASVIVALRNPFHV